MTTSSQDSTPVSGLRRWFPWRALVVALAVVGVELGLRQWTNYGKWIVNDKHPWFGWQMLPDQDAWSRHYNIPIHINNYGFRGPDWDAPVRAEDGTWVKDESVFRVAVLGDSMTYGISVPDGAIYSKVLQDGLRERFTQAGDPRTPVVMNFAVQGYVFEQSARVYEEKIRPWRPDVLVVPVSPHGVMPFPGGEPATDFPYANSVLRTATYDWLFRDWIHPWRGRLSLAPNPKTGFNPDDAWGVGDTPLKRVQDLEARFTPRPYAPEFQSYWRADIERKKGVLEQVVADGGMMVILTLPRLGPLLNDKLTTPAVPYQMWIDGEAARSDGRPRVLLVDGYEYARAASRDLIPWIWERKREAQERGTDQSMPALLEGSPFANQYLYLIDDEGHYNPKGHRTVARALYEEFIEHGLVP